MSNKPDTGPQYLEESVEPRLLDRLATFPRPEAAIDELLDNSYDSRGTGPLVVNLTIDKDGRFIYEDSGGVGMNFERLQRWSKWGSSDKASGFRETVNYGGSLGRNGYGGKAAVEYLAGGGARMICAGRGETEEIKVTFDIGGPREQFRRHPYERVKTRPGPGFTHLEINKLRASLDPNRLRNHIGKVYSRAILEKKIIVNLNGKDVEALPRPYGKECDEGEFQVGAATRVRFWIDQLPESKSLPRELRPGLAVSMFGRLIQEAWMAGHPTAESVPGMGTLFGEVDIESSTLGLALGKNEVEESTEWGEISAKMHEILGSRVALILAEHHSVRIGGKEKQAFLIAEKIMRIVALGQGDMTMGTARPERSHGEGNRINESHGRTQVTRPNVPTSHAPEQAVGKRERLGNSVFAGIKREQLGKRRESAIEENPDGRRFLVIGTDYYGYRRAAESGVLTEHILKAIAKSVGEVSAHLGVVDWERVGSYQDELYADYLEAGKKEKLIGSKHSQDKD
ncbi:MAG: ATP-binding protein [Patescibacteria group bacterium]|nr:ATP-binding protein [Patescibacteria group bacterium]MCL5432206.1 ATP-binding protein [Patescibacteria group bacterium]